MRRRRRRRAASSLCTLTAPSMTRFSFTLAASLSFSRHALVNAHRLRAQSASTVDESACVLRAASRNARACRFRRCQAREATRFDGSRRPRSLARARASRASACATRPSDAATRGAARGTRSRRFFGGFRRARVRRVLMAHRFGLDGPSSAVLPPSVARSNPRPSDRPARPRPTVIIVSAGVETAVARPCVTPTRRAPRTAVDGSFRFGISPGHAQTNASGPVLLALHVRDVGWTRRLFAPRLPLSPHTATRERARLRPRRAEARARPLVRWRMTSGARWMRSWRRR